MHVNTESNRMRRRTQQFSHAQKKSIQTKRSNENDYPAPQLSVEEQDFKQFANGTRKTNKTHNT